MCIKSPLQRSRGPKVPRWYKDVSDLFPSKGECPSLTTYSHSPTIPFKTKNSWAGNMPISNNKNDTYYFWLWGKDDAKPNKDVVIWIHGGPTCSSLIAMLTQSGPFVYPSLDARPHPNPHSWTKTANMLYVEQPIGVGFTTGTPTGQEKAQFADQFAGFLDNFFITFPELEGGNVYFAGESYAGVYLSHIMARQYALGNKHNVKGALFINTLISDPVVQTALVTYNFAVKNAKTIGFTQADLAAIKKDSDKCNYTSYTRQHLTYPATGKLPDINREGCDTYVVYDTLARKRKANYNVCEWVEVPFLGFFSLSFSLAETSFLFKRSYHNSTPIPRNTSFNFTPGQHCFTDVYSRTTS